MNVLAQLVLVLTVVTVVIAPIPLLGRAIERRRAAAGRRAVAEARRARRPAARLPLGYLDEGREYLERKQANWLRGRNRATVVALEAIEHRALDGMDAVLRDVLSKLLGGMSQEERAWALIGTDAFPLVAV